MKSKKKKKKKKKQTHRTRDKRFTRREGVEARVKMMKENEPIIQLDVCMV